MNTYTGRAFALGVWTPNGKTSFSSFETSVQIYGPEWMADGQVFGKSTWVVHVEEANMAVGHKTADEAVAYITKHLDTKGGCPLTWASRVNVDDVINGDAIKGPVCVGARMSVMDRYVTGSEEDCWVFGDKDQAIYLSFAEQCRVLHWLCSSHRDLAQFHL